MAFIIGIMPFIIGFIIIGFIIFIAVFIIKLPDRVYCVV
jgi:hypothetical protein